MDVNYRRGVSLSCMQIDCALTIRFNASRRVLKNVSRDPLRETFHRFIFYDGMSHIRPRSLLSRIKHDDRQRFSPRGKVRSNLVFADANCDA